MMQASNAIQGQETGPTAAAPPRATRLEHWLLLLLCVAMVVYWALQLDVFHFPNNDYYSFEDEAVSLGHAELPRSFKRAPIFPAAMALLAPLLPEPHAHFHAAQLLNMAFSLGFLLLVFRVASRTIGPGAALVACLLATNPDFDAMAVDGLVEPSLGFFVALAFVLLQTRSGWRWLAAAAAALSRFDAAVLVPVLVAIDWRETRRFWRPVGLGALALLPLLAWTALGAWKGSGASPYIDLMEGMGWNKAPDFLLTSLKEPFAGLYERFGLRPRSLLFELGVLLPLAFGVRCALREFQRDALALMVFYVLSVGVIVAFGISKARYVYPTQWILELLWTLGMLRGAAWLVEHVRGATPSRLAPWIAAAVGLAWLVLSADATHRLLAEPRVTGAALELGYLAVAFAVAAGAALRGVRSSSRSPLAAALLVLALATPLLAGGLQRKVRGQRKAYHANHSAWVAAEWLREHLPADGRAVTQHRQQILFLGGLEPEQLASFAGIDAEDAPTLRQVMLDRGLTHALYTWRKPVQTPSDAYYHRRLKSRLAELFQSGGPVAGFEHLATLELPPDLERDPVQIYRVVP